MSNSDGNRNLEQTLILNWIKSDVPGWSYDHFISDILFSPSKTGFLFSQRSSKRRWYDTTFKLDEIKRIADVCKTSAFYQGKSDSFGQIYSNYV